jgi:hypothetical protein
MDGMTLASRVRVPEEVLARPVGDEAVLVHLATGTYYALDPIGARAWQLLERGDTLGEVCVTMGAEYEVETAQLERDLRALVRQLAEYALIVVV